MKKILPAALTLCLIFSSSLRAQPTSNLSGIYGKLTLGVDPSGSTVTGYYSEIDDPPNLPSSECAFYIWGKLQGDHYAIQAWEPGKDKNAPIPGELKIFPSASGTSSVLLKLQSYLSRDCTALRPNLDKAEGILLDKNKSGAWTEVRVVGNSKSPYYQTPDLNSPQRGTERRGAVLTVTAQQAGWAQVQANQKSKGWIQESNLYPMKPGETMPRPVEAPAVPAPKAEAKDVAKPESKSAAAAPVPPPASPRTQPVAALETKRTSKAELLRRLKLLDTQAFGLALQVLASPSKRNALAPSSSALEKELNDLVGELNQADSAAYRNESSRIYEAYLDLQYVRQEQAVVSLRLRQEILKISP